MPLLPPAVRLPDPDPDPDPSTPTFIRPSKRVAPPLWLPLPARMLPPLTASRCILASPHALAAAPQSPTVCACGSALGFLPFCANCGICTPSNCPFTSLVPPRVRPRMSPSAGCPPPCKVLQPNVSNLGGLSTRYIVISKAQHNP